HPGAAAAGNLADPEADGGHRDGRMPCAGGPADRSPRAPADLARDALLRGPIHGFAVPDTRSGVAGASQGAMSGARARGSGSARVAAIFSVVLAGCSGPQSMIDPAGPGAEAVAALWWWMAGFSAIVLVLVCGLWLHAMRRAPRARPQQEERRIATRWIVGGGIVLPVASIIVLLAFGIPIGQRLLPGGAGAEPLRIEAIAHQWWWEIRYPGVEEALVNEFRLPTGRPVDVHTSSRDVIH